MPVRDRAILKRARSSRHDGTFILGAGMTGLAAGWSLRAPVFEADPWPGGICSSYYIRPRSRQRLSERPADGEAYRFETGGGHWIFRADREVKRFIGRFVSAKRYTRRSSVYFSRRHLYVPYPLQNNLRFFERKTALKALKEMSSVRKRAPSTMKEWMRESFGATLCRLFFYPFHDRYTAALYGKIAPQDAYKSPVDLSLVRRGARTAVPSVGYNATFIYPREGLDALIGRVAQGCDIRYKKRITRIDIKKKKLSFADGTSLSYARLISTLPLNRMVEMAGVRMLSPRDPHTSALVLNIGALRGKRSPHDHWSYIPDSRSGFFRVGCYSNVDALFLPRSSQISKERVSIYVERSYPGHEKPSERDMVAYADSVVRELKAWQFIREAEVIDRTWIDVAYTWRWPGSQWREEAIEILKKHDIHQLGRYGRWNFQGIADSIGEGLSAKDIL